MQLPPKVTERAFARLAEIGAADQGQALRVAVEGGGARVSNMKSLWTSPQMMIWCWKVQGKRL